MATRQFAVRCATSNQPGSTEQLRAELTAGGLEEVIVVPNVLGDRLLIKGLAIAESKDAAVALVEDQIYDATLDLIILEPGVWVDEGIR
jgi:hypothetical protein